MRKILPKQVFAFMMSVFIFLSSFVFKMLNEKNPYQADVIIAQSEEADYLFFPDVLKLPDRKILVSFYKNGTHGPDSPEDPFGKLCLVESTDNGESWSQAREVMSTEKLIQLGICTSEETVEARDPNLAILNDGTLLMTFFTRRYGSDAFIKTYMMESSDGGLSWGTPFIINSELLDQYCAKRGDIAVFDNDEILVPLYGGSSSVGSEAVSVVVRGTKISGQWQWSNEVVLAISSEGKNYNEVSLVATGGNTVYALAREPGTLFQSTDGGLTWAVIDTQGALHQPGFAKIDENRVFVTWSRPGSPRAIFGKMFYLNEGWGATKEKLIYALPKALTGSVDMGDPSSTLTADGKILVIYYQTMDKMIGGSFLNPDDWTIE